MYSLPSTSQTRDPFPVAIVGGAPPAVAHGTQHRRGIGIDAGPFDLGEQHRISRLGVALRLDCGEGVSELGRPQLAIGAEGADARRLGALLGAALPQLLLPDF